MGRFADSSLLTIAETEADERFVFVISDANFDRYRISPADFGLVLLRSFSPLICRKTIDKVRGC